jgi:Flp pilus assembly protein TadG
MRERAMRRLTLITRCIGDERGNVAMIFGVVLFIILGAAGIAIDVTRSSMKRTEIHEATDAGVLAAARYKAGRPNADDDELTAVARKVFDASIKDKAAITIDAFSVTFDDANDKFVLDVDATLDALFMGVFGQGQIDVDTVSEVRVSGPPTLEIALALDVTGSMNQKGKISAMKNAAKDLIDSLFEADGADVKIGLVPFAQYASIGTEYDAAPWLIYPGPAFKGCVGSRDYPYNTTDDDYSLYKIPGLTGAACPDALTPLSTDEEDLTSKVDEFDANGWTYIPAGLMPAWQLLSPEPPFSEGMSYAGIAEVGGVKAIVLMTDGENTRAPDYPTHNSVSEVLANELTAEICVNIKKDEITIYTVAFDVSDPDIKSILEDCATSPSHYFDAADADELSSAFASIASSLRNISLSK